MNLTKPNLLVVPSAYPENDNDIKGIFILDYIKCALTNFNVSVLTWQFNNDKDGLEKFEKYSCQFYKLYIKRNSGIIGKVFGYFKFFKLLYNSLDTIPNINVIHTHGGAIPGVVTTRFSKKKRIPNIITEHTGPFSKICDNFISKIICSYAMRNSYLVLPVSNDLKNQILNCGIRPKRMYTIYNPVDCNLFVPGTQKENSILFVGRLESYKGGLRSIKAFCNIAEKFESWNMRIIGDGPEKEEMILYVKNQGMQSRITFEGQKNKQEIAGAMSKASVFIFPSEHETFGLVVAEAMSAGLPVITSNVTAMPEFVTSNDGMLVDPNNINDITSALSHVISNLNTFDRIAISKRVNARFSFEVFGKKLKDIYYESMNNKCAV